VALFGPRRGGSGEHRRAVGVQMWGAAIQAAAVRLQRGARSSAGALPGTSCNRAVPSRQVDSAMSLIQAAKNLMNAVVQTVKASYVASTKYQKSQGMASLNLPAVSWKMKAPEKKPLVKREKQDETQTKIKRASQKKHVNPVQALSEFKAMESI